MFNIKLVRKVNMGTVVLVGMMWSAAIYTFIKMLWDPSIKNRWQIKGAETNLDLPDGITIDMGPANWKS